MPSSCQPRSFAGSPASVPGAALIAALQELPYRDIEIEPSRERLPARDVEL